ncbi:uncharacterized protein UBRO_20381 [Ustilago bromivora]|uniref:Reverse transcriptase domain-containing protein n=1 Tax=Ustilago bromivora TaxID=307758 RepID=A0A1K0GC78_9BASI|nr:uncharacterized protein UBRO_20381 [Ustilago bromivora]
MWLDLAHLDALCPEALCRVSPDKRQVIDDTLDQLLSWDIIKPSNSPVSYPVLLIKQGPKWRFCVDYRGLNTATIANQYPLLHINDIFQALRSHKFFSRLDVVRGYHQLNVNEGDYWKTTFVCHHRLYQYKRVPFGLKNMLAFFQCFMDHLLGCMRWTEALVYLDDIVVFSSLLEQHARSLDCLLKAAHKVGLKFSPTKCHFALSSLTLLGRQVSTQGISVLTNHTQAIQTLTPPVTLQGLYHMVGLFNYYRDFIPNYTGLATPLTNLLWGHKYQHSTKGTWQLVDADRKTTRAVDIKIDWGMAQDKTLAELKAALSSLPTLAYPDFNHPFLLYVDASQQAFAAALHQQLPLSDSDSIKNKSATASPAEANNLDIPPMLTHQQKLDGLLKSIVDAIGAGYTRVGYEIQDSTLVYVGLQHTVCHLCVPISDLPTIFHKAHNLGGHFGFAKTALHLKSIHHPHLLSTLQAYIDNCPTCLCMKLGCHVGEHSIDQTLSADRPFHTLSADLLLGLQDCKGLDAALVIMDMFSELVLTAPCSSYITSTQLFNLLADLILRKGWKPKVIITDSDKRFIGITGQRFATSIGTELRPLAPYHQQANPVERHIQMLQCVLHTFAVESAKDWVNILPAAKLAINSTPLLTTEQTPFNLDCPIPGTQRHTKLDPGKVGPFPVKQVLSHHHFKLDLPSGLYSDDLFNISQLEPAPKECNPFNHSLDAPVTTDGQGATCFEVEAIMGQQPFRNYVQYHVKWHRDPHTMWEFEEDLLEDGCKAAIQDWNSKHASTPAAITHTLDSSLYERPIAFISTTTSPADTKLLGLELKISCLAWAFHHLQHFLEGASKITVVTDHAPLGAVL